MLPSRRLPQGTKQKLSPGLQFAKERDGGQTESISLVLASIHASCSEAEISAFELDGETLLVKKLIWDLWGLGRRHLCASPPISESGPWAALVFPELELCRASKPVTRCDFLSLSARSPCVQHPVLTGVWNAVDICLGMEHLQWLWSWTVRSEHTAVSFASYWGLTEAFGTHYLGNASPFSLHILQMEH